MSISTEQVKLLRDETDISIMKCKKALEEADGDMEKARAILQEESAKAASKKSDRDLGDGTVASYIHSNGSVGTMVVLMCETDFVSKNEEFIRLANDIALHIAGMNPQKIKSEEGDEIESDQILLEQSFMKDPEKTIKTLIEEATQKFGERVEITQFDRFAI